MRNFRRLVAAKPLAIGGGVLACAIALGVTGCSGSPSPTTSPTAPTSPSSASPASPSSGVATPSNSASSAAKSNDFIVDYPQGEASAPSHTLRSRLVRLNDHTLLNDQGQQLPGQRTLQLTLFPDLAYQALVRPVDSVVSGGLAWDGTLTGVKLSTVSIVRFDGVWMVKIASPEHVLEISSVGDQVYRLIEVDPRAMPPEH